MLGRYGNLFCTEILGNGSSIISISERLSIILYLLAKKISKRFPYLNTDIQGDFIMEIIILVILLGGAIVWFSTKEKKSDTDTPVAPYKVEPNLTTKADGIGHESVLDVNKDGKVDVKDAVAAVKKTKAKAKTVANEVVTEVKTVAKKTAVKAKKVEETVVAEVKKVTARKPKAPKA